MAEPQVSEVNGPGIRVEQVILEEVVFSHRADFMQLPADTKADIGTATMKVGVGVTDPPDRALLHFDLESSPDNRPVYNVRLRLTAFFSATPQTRDFLRKFATTAGPGLIVPFVREALASITSRGRFGPVWLKAINTRQIVQGLLEEDKRPQLADQQPVAQVEPAARPRAARQRKRRQK